jgi:glycosyltransferase involved in cell wall biosynthesis
VRELVKDGVMGYITRPREYKDTTDRILNMLKDRNSFFKMQEEALKSIDDSFDISVMAHNTDNLYRSLA